MASVLKKGKELYKSLDKLYIKDKQVIISWLDKIKKPENQKDGKIPSLFLKSMTKMQILTVSEEGTYNLILRWIKKNASKFTDYDFTGVPDSAFILSADLLKMDDEAGAATGEVTGKTKYEKVSSKRTFKTIQDVEMWFKEPEIHPIKRSPMSPMSEDYYDIYKKAYKIRKNNYTGVTLHDDYISIQNLFPKNHLLFGDIDLIYYACVKNIYPYLYKNIYKGRENILAICELLTEKLEDTVNKETVLETEIELLRNRFNDKFDPTTTSYLSGRPNMVIIKSLINNFKRDLINSFLDTDYMTTYEYPERMKKIKEDADNIKGYWFITFLETNKMANGETPIKYFINTLKKPNPPNWISEILKLYNDYKLYIKDIDECFNPASGIVENVEDKKLTIMNDPLDEYFEVYEKDLAEIRNPIYSQLIDLTTFKPKENLKYLNDAQYIAFKIEKDRYDELWKKYRDSQTLYETTRRGSSPKPPEKPKITLPWGKVHTIAREIDPIYIKDDIVVKFGEEYAKAQPIINEYNRIKNMSYQELKYHKGESLTSSEKRVIEENELFSMTREGFVNNVLYDYSDLADKCSESIDILTSEELDDENYPLSKLQLMARMKVYTPDKKKYRTECIYAPKLYNYLIKCINSKEPFINPVTKAKYTQENIEELMKVMRIIDPKIEVPVFIKHRNDTKLKINYTSYEVNLRDIGADASYGSVSVLRFNRMYISRMIGGEDKLIQDICYIPDNIEATGTFATGSADLNSYTMLVNLYKLFNEGRLLYNYLPPYNILLQGTRNQYRFLKPQIHFNRIRTIDLWLRKSNEDATILTKDEFVNRFKHYAQEINNYIF